LKLAKDIVRDGSPADKVRVLEGLGEVLHPDADPGPRVVVTIGIKDEDLVFRAPLSGRVGYEPPALPAPLAAGVIVTDAPAPQKQIVGARLAGDSSRTMERA
jgi:hypothetical protein